MSKRVRKKSTSDLKTTKAQLSNEPAAPQQSRGELGSGPTPSPGEAEGLLDAMPDAMVLVDRAAQLGLGQHLGLQRNLRAEAAVDRGATLHFSLPAKEAQ